VLSNAYRLQVPPGSGELALVVVWWKPSASACGDVVRKATGYPPVNPQAKALRPNEPRPGDKSKVVTVRT
jgi:hypothetical protein